jgi:hypothetical protein
MSSETNPGGAVLGTLGLTFSPYAVTITRGMVAFEDALNAAVGKQDRRVLEEMERLTQEAFKAARVELDRIEAPAGGRA